MTTHDLPAAARNDLDAGLLVTREVTRASRHLRISYAWQTGLHTGQPRSAGRALQWWLEHLESPTTRRALMENHHRV